MEDLERTRVEPPFGVARRRGSDCHEGVPSRSAHSAGRSPSQVGRWVVKRRQRRRGDSRTVLRCWPGTSHEHTMPAGHLGDCKRRTSRSFRIGAILVVVSLVLAGCTSGPSKTASRETSASESGKSSTSTTVTSVPAAKLIEPPGPVSAHPALLDEASAACRRAGASRHHVVRGHRRR